MTVSVPPDVTLQARQARLLRVTLWVMCLYGALLGTLNLTLFDDPLIASFDFGLTLLAGATLFLSHRNGRLQLASWLTVGLLIAVLSAFIAVSSGGNYALLWVTVLPPLAFFLLGSRHGAWVTALFFAAVLVYIWLRLPHFQPRPFGIATLLNFAEVMTALWLLYRYSEKTREEAWARLRHLSHTDPLTGLWNRARLDEALAQSLALGRRSGQATAMLLIDLDHFKVINDSRGHLAGDGVLTQLATRLRDTVRGTDYLGRWGGEEFVVVCPDTPREGALQLAEKLREVVAASPFQPDIPLTISIGVAVTDGHLTAAELLAQADARLYRAKAEGRNRVCG